MRNRNGLAAAGLLGAALLSAGCEADTLADDAYDSGDDAAYEDDAATEEYDGSNWLIDFLVGLTFDASDGSGGGGSGAPASVAARGDLVRSAAPSDPDARGLVAVGRRRRREAFAVRAMGLDPGAPLDLLVGDRFDDLLPIASLSADGRGIASFTPAVLPAGAASLKEFAGRRVEIRDGAGRTLLTGRVPALRHRGGDRRASRGYRDDGSGVRVRVSLAAIRSVGRQVFRFDARGLPPGAGAELRILGREGAMIPVASGTADGAGRFSLRADSRAGDPLPGGEEWIESLDVRPFEVLCGGEVLADGEFPAL